MGFCRNFVGNVLFSDREFLSRDVHPMVFPWFSHENLHFSTDHGCAEGISVSKWTVEEVEDLERSESPVDLSTRGTCRWENPWENGGLPKLVMEKPFANWKPWPSRKFVDFPSYIALWIFPVRYVRNYLTG